MIRANCFDKHSDPAAHDNRCAPDVLQLAALTSRLPTVLRDCVHCHSTMGISRVHRAALQKRAVHCDSDAWTCGRSPLASRCQNVPDAAVDMKPPLGAHWDDLATEGDSDGDDKENVGPESDTENRCERSPSQGDDASDVARGAKRGRKPRVATADHPRSERRLKYNMQERHRMVKMNEALEQLRQKIPQQMYLHHKKLSKIKTLRLASAYIAGLSATLQTFDAKMRHQEHLPQYTPAPIGATAFRADPSWRHSGSVFLGNQPPTSAYNTSPTSEDYCYFNVSEH